MYVHAFTNTDIHIKAILRNQVCFSLWSAHAWFNSLLVVYYSKNITRHKMSAYTKARASE